MKKRSLFAAVAMLIVSAIVLTSATYAWFAASSTATVGALSAAVSNTDGNLLVKATGTYAKANSVFKGGIDSTDYEGLPATLKPVSFAKNASTGLIEGPVKVAYDGATFTPGTLATTDTTSQSYDRSAIEYQHYSFDVQYTTTDAATAKKVTLTPKNLSRGGTSFIYVYVEVAHIDAADSSNNSTDGYWYAGGDNYYPVTTAVPAAGVADVAMGTPTASRNSILDSDSPESLGTYLGSQVTTLNSLSAIDIMENMTATTSGSGENVTTSPATFTTSVNVYVWAEGNDSDCHGAVSGSGAGIAFDLAAANQT